MSSNPEVDRLVERLENYYNFECDGGPLRNCVEWQQLLAALQSPRLNNPPEVDRLVERWEYIARGCRDLAESRLECAEAMRAAAINRDECAKELRAALQSPRPDSQTECCGVSIAADQRYCSKCGYEARVARPDSQQERLRALAMEGVRLQHGELGLNGHRMGNTQADLAACPHPDCRLVREGTSPPAYRTASCDLCCGGEPFVHVGDCPWKAPAASLPVTEALIPPVASMADVIHVRDGEWIEPTPPHDHKLICCDCGLVHLVDFRIEDDHVQFRAYRNEQESEAWRAANPDLPMQPRRDEHRE